jgi:hypothetical protein
MSLFLNIYNLLLSALFKKIHIIVCIHKNIFVLTPQVHGTSKFDPEVSCPLECSDSPVHAQLTFVDLH